MEQVLILLNIYIFAPLPFSLIRGRSRVHRFANFRSKTVSQTVFLSCNLPSTAPAHFPIADSFSSDSCFVRPIAYAIATHTGYRNPAPIPCVFPTTRTCSTHFILEHTHCPHSLSSQIAIKNRLCTV